MNQTLEDFIIDQVKTRPHIYNGRRSEAIDKLVEKDFEIIAKASKIKNLTGSIAHSLWETIKKQYINDVKVLESLNENSETIEYSNVNMTRVYSLSFLYETVSANISSEADDLGIEHHNNVANPSSEDSDRTNDSVQKPANSLKNSRGELIVHHGSYDRRMPSRYKAKNAARDPEIVEMLAEVDEGIKLLYERYELDKTLKKHADASNIEFPIRGTASYYRSNIISALQAITDNDKPDFYLEVIKIVNDHRKL